MSNASSKNVDLGAQAQGDDRGMPRNVGGENHVLSTSGESLQNEARRLDGKQAHNEPFHDHPDNRALDSDNDRLSLPAFDDPAFSAHSAKPLVTPDAPVEETPPVDTQYAGHSEFSQQAAANRPPRDFGISEPTDDVDAKTRHSDGVNPREPAPQQQSGSGPAIARHSKEVER